MPRKRSSLAALLLVAAIFVLLASPALNPLLIMNRNASAAGWSTPVNISSSGAYDNAPDITASMQGAVAIAWERRVTANPTSNYILEAANSSLGGGFAHRELSHTSPQKTSGSVRMKRDSLGRRHLVWWQQDGAAVCDYYARIEADGRTSITERVPGTCGLKLKNTALAIGPGNSVHALFGQNLINLAYWSRNDAGWTVQGEAVPATNRPENVAIGVTAGGTVIAAWQGTAPKGSGNTDVFTATRAGGNRWTVQDVSEGLSPGCPNDSSTYLPSLAADPSGGMRMVWADERCDPRNPDPRQRDVYYREWTAGAGWGGAPVRVARAVGGANENAIAVDASGVAHLLWVATRNVTEIKIYYASGRGDRFTAPTTPFAAWAGGANAKDVSADYSAGYLHVAFTSTRDDPQKEVYYSYLFVGPAQPPTPTPPPPPGPSVPGAGSRTFPETGKTVTGVFLQYWDTHGGLLQQGFPVSNVMPETSDLNHKQYLVQYFERAVFEYHPENQPPYNVLLSQLGTFRYKKKYPGGAPNQRVNPDEGRIFAETGHKIGGSFWVYWQSHGDIVQQGYPLSDELTEVSDHDGKTYVVQYFERSIFEWHPDNQPPFNVLLSLLGVFRLREKYGIK